MLRHLTTPAVARQMVDAISHQMSVEGILNLQIFDDKSSACYFARVLGVVMTAFFSQIYPVYLRCWQQHASHKMIQMFPFKRVLC